MPRAPRSLLAGQVFHVVNRGNGQVRVFHKPSDYEVFLELLGAAKQREPVKLFAFCLMPNHFHLVVEPEDTNSLSKFLQWLMTSHVRRYHKHYQSSGHIWQGRFKSFPIQRDEHLITVLRYVWENPVRAGLVKTAEDWEWSALRNPNLVDNCPVEFNVTHEASSGLSSDQLKAVRECVNGQKPFGSPEWRSRIR